MAPEKTARPLLGHALWLGDSRRHPATAVDKPVTGHCGHRSHESDPRPGRHGASVPSIPPQRRDSVTAGWLRTNRRSTCPGRADNELTLRPLETGIDGLPCGLSYQQSFIDHGTNGPTTRDRADSAQRGEGRRVAQAFQVVPTALMASGSDRGGTGGEILRLCPYVVDRGGLVRARRAQRGVKPRGHESGVAATALRCATPR